MVEVIEDGEEEIWIKKLEEYREGRGVNEEKRKKSVSERKKNESE